MLSPNLITIFAFVGLAVAQSDEQPCAVISRTVQDLPRPTAGIEDAPRVDARLALNCLLSVPFEQQRALDLVYSLRAYAEFHSTTAYLKNPPDSYLLPAVDLDAGFRLIEDRINAGEYSGEYDYAVDLLRLYRSTHDGHFTFNSDILSNAFIFRRPVTLVSVSVTGTALPEVYVGEDFGAQGFEASAVTEIDGKDVLAWLGEELTGDFRDPDALYNGMFYSTNSLGGTGGLGRFAVPVFYPGDNTTISFENGTTTTISNTAMVISDFTGVDSGEAFFEKFCNLEESLAPAPTSSVEPSPTSSTIPTPTVMPGYPSPVAQDAAGSIAGYFLEDDDFAEVAILSIPTFSIPDFSGIQKALEDFLSLCKEQAKKKLIVDVQGNPGGVLVLAFEVFGQLLPGLEPLIAQNLRAHETLDIFGQAITDLYSDFSAEDLDEVNALGYVSPFNTRTLLNLEGENFASWPDVYGPVEADGANLTTLYQRNFNDPLFSSALSFVIAGFGNRSEIPEYFQPEDMIILTDGRCDSTCSILVNLLRENAKIQTVTVGGRPQFGPMQAVGGVRGPQSLPLDTIHQIATTITANATDEQKAAFAGSTIANLTDVPLKRTSLFSASVNLANGVRLGNDSLTPLQFLYEAADCRVFYTAEMLTDVSVTWKAAAQFQSGDNSICVRDSTGHPSAVGRTERPDDADSPAEKDEDAERDVAPTEPGNGTQRQQGFQGGASSVAGSGLLLSCVLLAAAFVVML